MRPVDGEDFLLVVDSNVGFNKANLFVRQNIDYRVDRDATGLIATLTVGYTHTAPAGSETTCDRNAGYGATYEDLGRRCYWNFLRVFAPGGSELIEASGVNDATTEPAERGSTSFTGDFTLKPGEQHAVTVRYRLPPSVQAAPYKLLVRKQAGTMANPVTITAGPCHEDDAAWRVTSGSSADKGCQ